MEGLAAHIRPPHIILGCYKHIYVFKMLEKPKQMVNNKHPESLMVKLSVEVHVGPTRWTYWKDVGLLTSLFVTFFNIKFVALSNLRSLLNLGRQEMTKDRADNQ